MILSSIASPHKAYLTHASFTSLPTPQKQLQEADIRIERNALLQCIRCIVENDFFAHHTPGAPLRGRGVLPVTGAGAGIPPLDDDGDSDSGSSEESEDDDEDESVEDEELADVKERGELEDGEEVEDGGGQDKPMHSAS
ncbi:hypothetical protein BDK51DRAFT_40393 [Blyttiomyces helicus]|uniref:Uncharacterized protein n=1 Tax=Blyttiomyces helicus TaxID=388810 RepID=A0A4P9WGS5_9FUNG|nr:hypothetical protein BDK51DRAFT_40393 [Blyttiomyces helicus]|eukprot:RKO91552.1 hypothetical protein BDK51DRAFT_40393 [Blyttiomyces helicus]